MNKKSMMRFGPLRIATYKGRMIRDGEGHAGATGGGENNPQGNSGVPGNDGGSQNNPSNSFDPTAFWNGPTPKEPDSNSNPNPTPTPSPTPTPTPAPRDQGTQLGQQIMQQIEGIQFGEVFNQAIADKLAEGDYADANAAIQTNLKTALQQSIRMNATIMQQFGTAMMEKMKQMIEGSHNQRDNNQTLESSFPIVKDQPGLRPVVQSIFDQSLKNTNGNREEAVKQTKQMLKFMGHAGGEMMGIESKPDDNFMGDSARSLVDDLLGRN